MSEDQPDPARGSGWLSVGRVQRAEPSLRYPALLYRWIEQPLDSPPFSSLGLPIRLRPVGRHRWNYDRIVHLAYGLLLTYPVWEVMRRVVHVDGFWAYSFAVTVIVATGAFYELLEMWVALIVAPELKDAFVGTQGDIWDAQKDIALAMYGALAVVVLTAVVRRRGRLIPHDAAFQTYDGSPHHAATSQCFPHL